MSDEEFNFEEQIRLEEEEQKKAAGAKTKVDEDGTEYEWDEAKQAWFPKIDANFIAQYQMNYGNFEGCKDPDEGLEKKEDSTASHHLPPAPPVDHPGYYYWYYHVYLPSQPKSEENENNSQMDAKDSIENGSDSEKNKNDSQKDEDDSQKNENDMQTNEKDTQKKVNDSQKKENDMQKYESSTKDSGQLAGVTKMETDSRKEEESTEDLEKEAEKSANEPNTNSDQAVPEASDDSNDESYKKYCEWYYTQQQTGDGNSNAGDWASYYEYYKNYYDKANHGDETSTGAEPPGQTEEGDEDEENTDAAKKAKKRKHQQEQKEQGWFEMDQTRSTSVYVSNLPHDITDEEFKELMTKCGLVSMDPQTQKLKLKLYRNKDGEVKGDGLCSYIKMESVDLALDILDGTRLRNYEISVELAKFELKGSYDPAKKKKKLTNKEKRRLKERQEKLFDWKLDKGRGVRNNCEKTLVFKNVFDPTDFDANPALIFQLRDKLKLEGSKYGTVRKVIVYDRHPDRVATVTFAEVEEADVCRGQMDNRFFNQKTIQVEAWDGKTKYTVKESEEEEKKRLDEWTKFLQEEENSKNKEKKMSESEGKKSVKEPIEGSVEEPIKDAVEEPVKESVDEEFIEEPIKDPVEESPTDASTGEVSIAQFVAAAKAISKSEASKSKSEASEAVASIREQPSSADTQLSEAMDTSEQQTPSSTVDTG